ncbi:alpha/beta fold hydrolase [Microbulbifer rhizosphaerae]|uniref:Pimeloyl-ACP methyl ester carboxylesterase n=1 Tax=Microbulbifer rhizosphaerae TaxID=1562603 RepID=A0A7W4WFP8_9GAMM|nr:alpha/beta fold hydrolase [Microbulbifer rhizosphaerae]MBB3063379.1 pimeloyl-ACP methyl ester carboxylesterase [Microbulbifer rhizosphaerae]
MEKDNPANLVMLPGLDGTGILFRPLLAALPKWVRPRVIAYPKDQQLSIAEYADLVARQLPHGGFTLLAESFSGLVALELMARKLPGLKSILFVVTFAAPPRPRLLNLARRLPGTGSVIRIAPDFLLQHFCLGKNASATELSLLREALAEVHPAILRHRLSLIASCQPLEIKPQQPPCHYLQAARDRLVPPTAARWFGVHLESCQLDSLEGPHLLLQTRPKACAEWIAGKIRPLAEPADDMASQ